MGTYIIQINGNGKYRVVDRDDSDAVQSCSCGCDASVFDTVEEAQAVQGDMAAKDDLEYAADDVSWEDA